MYYEYPDGCMSSHFRPPVRTRPETPGETHDGSFEERGSSDMFMQLICALLPVPASTSPFRQPPLPVRWFGFGLCLLVAFGSRLVGVWRTQEPPAVTLGTALFMTADVYSLISKEFV